MYYLRNNLTRTPYYNMKVHKVYPFRVLAEKEKEKANLSLQATRVDVVTLSRSARLYMENQYRRNDANN